MISGNPPGPWVKVCGLSERRHVEAAVAAGADAIGFVTHRPSPRWVDLDVISGLAADVPLLTVLLTVDQPPDVVMAAVERTGVAAVQPYGAHAAAVAGAALAAGLDVLRPVTAVVGLVLPDDGSRPLIDTPDDQLIGGTGRVFDWGILEGIEADFVLAGGLGPDNVARAIAAVAPWGVDASSGLEVAPGVKDVGKVTAFVEEAKRR